MSSEPKTIDERATELGCAPDLVPVIERLDVIIALLRRMPVSYTHHLGALADSVLRDVLPGSVYKPPVR